MGFNNMWHVHKSGVLACLPEAIGLQKNLLVVCHLPVADCKLKLVTSQPISIPLLLRRFSIPPFLLVPSSGLVVALFFQAMATWLTLSSSSRGDLSPLTLSAAANAAVICAILAATVAAFYSLGLGPVSSLLPTELFPVRLHTRGVGITVAVGRLTAAVVVGSFLPVLRTVGPAVASLVFGATLLFGVIFFYFFLPEMKGHNFYLLSAVQAGDSEHESAVWTHASSKADVPLHGLGGNLRARHLEGSDF